MLRSSLSCCALATSQAFTNSEDAIDNDCINAFFDLQLRFRQLVFYTKSFRGTYLDFRGIIINSAIADAHES